MCAGGCREPRRKGTRVAAPSGCIVPWAARASCWPQPQQLLPVSAAGSGRRCCTGAFPRRTVRRVLRVALAAFSAAPWQGFEKAERCPSLASLFPPQAAVGSAAVRIRPCIPFFKADKTETPVPGSDTGVLGGRGWIARAAHLKKPRRGFFTRRTVRRVDAVRIHPCIPFFKTDNTETPVPGSDTGVLGGRGWIRTTEAESSRFTVCPHWPLGNTPIFIFAVVWTACICYH